MAERRRIGSNSENKLGGFDPVLHLPAIYQPLPVQLFTGDDPVVVELVVA